MNRIILCLVCLLTTVSLFGMEPVKRIENGTKPKGKVKTLKFTEELRLTADQGDEYLWVGPTARVEPDHNGMMYVLDTRERRVLEFDQNGKFTRVVGKQGPGPGEFQMPQALQIFPDGTAMVHELVGPMVTVNYYDKGMVFKDRTQTQTLTGLLEGVVYAPDKSKKFANKVNVDMQKQTMVVFNGLMDEKSEPLIQVAQYEMMGINPARIGEANYWVEFMADRIRIGLHGIAGIMAFDSEGHFYSALNGQYQITQYDAKQNKTLEISRKYKPLPFTEEEITAVADPIYEILMTQLPPQLQEIITPAVMRRAVQKAEPPPVKPPVNGIVVMEDGHILVIFDSNLVTGKGVVDIFSPRGEYLGQAERDNRPFARMVFRNGKAYTMETVDGENELVRYDVKLVDAK
ncbi:6-bladed beta-propeller [Acanthopleuribacter pedis]|uniref:6-bladed beta-propeller n=1 Tax=Acanthopleuribacter pedis TaxID=442870 RepID=A0A8J7QD79_9BACT|nr:6-bladed beta-propeller [Acanthopleuribacter pedis]MBO1321634.1 6-bladed beta-propeller [Acanthopleuribacter pedis]